MFPSPATSSSTNSCCDEKKQSRYDYIVIGSGPGGTTIATRLALNNFKVLLIEAGPDYDDTITRTPVLWPEAELIPQIAAHFNPYLYSKKENITIEYPRGITLGGSAQINALIAMMANPSEWDDIAKITNDANWNSKNIRNKYQSLVENCEYCKSDDKNSDRNGWFNVSLSKDEYFLSLLFQDKPVMQDLLKIVSSQFKFNRDVNEDNTDDSYFYTPRTVTRDTGYRSGTYRRLKQVQAIRPSNLHIWTNSFVIKLIIDPDTKEACGVEYINGSFLYKASPLASSSMNSNSFTKFSAYAKREIIVSGGQWMSPQLLQLSGIGDRDLLDRFGIKTIQHLPGVGKNQQDRNEVSYIVKLKTIPDLSEVVDPSCTVDPKINYTCLVDAIDNPTNGFLTATAILTSILRSAKPKMKNFPDTVLSFIPLRFPGFRGNWVSPVYPETVGFYLTVNINFARVKNNLGTVQIQSTNAFDTPLIELNHFRGENKQTELNQIIDHIRFLRQLLLESEFSKYIDYEDLPGSDVKTDEQLTKYIKEYVWGHHACCTNKIGDTKTDPFAVVNSKGQVKDIRNLRIADISIFPKIPGYFPTLPIAIACEKIADDIMEDARN